MLSFYSSRIYKRLPIALQNAFVTFKGICYQSVRHGRKFRQYEKDLFRNERLSFDEMNDLQLVNLKKIIKHAYAKVPYYKELFDEQGITPQDIRKIEDLKKIPILQKDTLRKRNSHFLASNYNPMFLFKGATSGTTGGAISLYMNRSLIQGEHAFMRRQFRWAGCPPKGKFAYFRLDKIVPTIQKASPYFREEHLTNRIWLSNQHLSKDTAADYLQHLISSKVELLFGLPSNIFYLAILLHEQKKKVFIPSLKSIVTSSENLPDYQKKIIEKVFGVTVFDQYGSFERVAFIGTCEFQSYHIFSDYGITELIPLENSNEEMKYEIIGTSFLNYAMPLIRYRTGDVVTPLEGSCKCGRPFPRIKSIDGRVEETVVTPNKNLICLPSVAFDGIQHIRFSQIIQNNLNELTVLIVPETGFGSSELEKITKSLSSRLGNDMKIEVKIVDDIERLPNGKFKRVVSRLNKDDYLPNHSI